MTLIWTLGVPDAGAGRMFSIEDRIWDSQRTLVSDAVGRMLGQSREAFRRVCMGKREFWYDLKALAHGSNYVKSAHLVGRCRIGRAFEPGGEPLGGARP